MTALHHGLELPPHGLSGVVVGALLNHREQLVALGDAVHQAPYKAPPLAPVLEVKPRHTLACDGDAIVVPQGQEWLEVGVQLGIVIGRAACRAPVGGALQRVAGYLVVGDYSLTLSSHYRPAVRLKARDGFCPLGSQIVPAAEVANPDALSVEISIDGQTVDQGSTGARIRGVAQLIADVSEFMTLHPGDVLLLGRSNTVPRARAGQEVVMRIAGLGQLRNRLVAEHAVVEPCA